MPAQRIPRKQTNTMHTHCLKLPPNENPPPALPLAAWRALVASSGGIFMFMRIRSAILGFLQFSRHRERETYLNRDRVRTIDVNRMIYQLLKCRVSLPFTHFDCWPWEALTATWLTDGGFRGMRNCRTRTSSNRRPIQIMFH